jgi:hypothetical protein
MVGKGTQYQSPMILQLVKNHEEPTKMIDSGSIIEWVGVFFQVFWLALLSGSFLFLWVFALKLAGF